MARLLSLTLTACPPGTSHYSPRQRSGMLPLTNHGRPIDKDMLYPGRELMWLRERRVIVNGRGVKYDEISVVIGLDQATLADAQHRRGQPREPPNRILQCDYLLFAHIFTEYSRERPIGARMRINLQKCSLRRGRLLI